MLNKCGENVKTDTKIQNCISYIDQNSNANVAEGFQLKKLSDDFYNIQSKSGMMLVIIMSCLLL